MAILEGYIAIWHKYPEDERKIRVARPHLLSPSKKLLKDYKSGAIDWEVYETRFREQIEGNRYAMTMLREISKASKLRDVRLLCYEKNPPCHRFILIDMIKELDVRKQTEGSPW